MQWDRGVEYKPEAVLPPEELHKVLLTSLVTHGMRATAASLRKEAGLPADKEKSAVVNQSPQQTPRLPLGVSEEVAVECLKSQSLGREKLKSIGCVAEVVADQRQRLDTLRERVQQLRVQGSELDNDDAELQERLRSQRERIAGLRAEKAELEQLEIPLQRELRRKDDDAAAIRAEIEKQKEVENDMWNQLKQFQAELSALRSKKLIAEAAAKDAPPAIPMEVSDAEKIRRLLEQWELENGPRLVAMNNFEHVDTNRDGRLTWNNGEIKHFVGGMFHHYQIDIPPWQEHVWYEMYRVCDVDGSYSIDLEECYNFARLCFEETLRLLTHEGYEPAHVEKVHYAEPVQEPVRLEGHALLFNVLQKWDTCQDFQQDAMISFQQADGNRDGRLEWNSDEIRGFVRSIFNRHECPMPPWQDSVWYDMYRSVDVDHSYSLDINEALLLAKHCFEAAVRYFTENPTYQVHMEQGNVETSTTFSPGGSLQLQAQGGGLSPRVMTRPISPTRPVPGGSSLQFSSRGPVTRTISPDRRGDSRTMSAVPAFQVTPTFTPGSGTTTPFLPVSGSSLTVGPGPETTRFSSAPGQLTAGSIGRMPPLSAGSKPASGSVPKVRLSHVPTPKTSRSNG